MRFENNQTVVTSVIIIIIIIIIIISFLMLIGPATHRNIISTVKPTRCNNASNLYYFGMPLYIFRTVFPSIIRVSRLYIQQQAYVKQILLSAC